MEVDMPIAARMIAKSAEVEPGIRLEYVEAGHPDGVPVLFLHGSTDSWGSFEEVIELLPPSIRSIAVSLRGHGESSRPESGYRILDFSRDVRRFMDALNLQAAVIVGHSMGSFVGQRFAAEYPERTLGLVLMGSGPTLAGSPLVQEMVTALETMPDPVDADFVREFQAGTLVRPVNPDFFHAAVAESLKVPARVWLEMFTRLLEVDHTSLVGRIHAPTLVVWGSCDSVFGAEDQVVLRDAIPRARLITYEGGGHSFHWEDAATFATDLTAFCREVNQS
jgi:non-heme chloroperoxidase